MAGITVVDALYIYLGTTALWAWLVQRINTIGHSVAFGIVDGVRYSSAERMRRLIVVWGTSVGAAIVVPLTVAVPAGVFGTI